MDQLDIDPGQGWDTAVEQAVARSPRTLLILSPASVQSRNVRNEIAFALDEQKTIILFLNQDCTVPLQLRRIQHIDFRTEYARGLQVLIRVLGVEQAAAAIRDCSGGDPINRLAHRIGHQKNRRGAGPRRPS